MATVPAVVDGVEHRGCAGKLADRCAVSKLESLRAPGGVFRPSIRTGELGAQRQDQVVRR